MLKEICINLLKAVPMAAVSNTIHLAHSAIALLLQNSVMADETIGRRQKKRLH